MKTIKAAVFVAGFIFILTSCENRTFDKFYENEKEKIINTTSDLLEKIGFEKFEIIVYTHKSISNRIVAKSMSDTGWEGARFDPEGPYDNYDPAFKDMSDIDGWMRQKTLTANYELNAKKEIVYDNFSTVIIIEKINRNQKKELLRILDSLIINAERGDNILIVSKEDFNNLE